jgi:hypothetical protein
VQRGATLSLLVFLVLSVLKLNILHIMYVCDRLFFSFVLRSCLLLRKINELISCYHSLFHRDLT